MVYVHTKGGSGNEAIRFEAVPRRKHPLLGGRTEIEASEQARKTVISEAEKNHRAWVATEKLIKDDIKIEDVFGQTNARL